MIKLDAHVHASMVAALNTIVHNKLQHNITTRKAVKQCLQAYATSPMLNFPIVVSLVSRVQAHILHSLVQAS